MSTYIDQQDFLITQEAKYHPAIVGLWLRFEAEQGLLCILFGLHIRQVLLKANQIEAHVPFEFCVHFTVFLSEKLRHFHRFRE